MEHNCLKDILNVEMIEVSEMIKKIETEMNDYLEGSLVVVQRKGFEEYYWNKNKRERSYISNEDIELVKSLAQKSYDTQILKILKKRESALQKLTDAYMGNSIQDIYRNLSPARKALVTPIILPDDEFVKQWYEEHPGGQNNYRNDTPYYTNRGEHVRSKSEKIIADLFDNKGLVYVYEPKIKLKDGTEACPDFMVLNLRLRKVFIFEHFGMMDSEEYSANACRKISLYQKNGYMPGENFLFSMESQQYPLDIISVEKMIDHYLL